MKLKISLSVENSSNVAEVWEGEKKDGKKFRLHFEWDSSKRKDIISGMRVSASVPGGHFPWSSTSILNDPAIPNGKKIWEETIKNWKPGKTHELLRHCAPDVTWTFVKYGPGGVR
jgi:hypothetical protein